MNPLRRIDRSKAGALGALVCVVLFALLLFRTGGEEYEALTHRGSTVSNAKGVLAFADRRFGSDVTLLGAASEDEALCYFAADGQDVADSLFCGPVLHQGGWAPAVWDRYELAASVDDGKAYLSLAGAVERGVESPADRTLRRHDGQTPPPINLSAEAPDLAVLPPGFIGQLLVEQAGTFRPVDTEVRLGSDGSVRLTGLAELQQVEIDRGLRSVAGFSVSAEGERLVALRFEAEEGTPPFSVRFTDDNGVRATSFEAGRRPAYAVTSVKDNAFNSLRASIAYQGREQGIDLDSGALTVPLIAELYKPSEQMLALKVNDQKVSVPSANGEIDARLSDYEIVKVSKRVHVAGLGWSPHDQRWLVVDILGLSAPSFYPRSTSTAKPWEISAVLDRDRSSRLELPGGEPIEVADFRSIDNRSFFDARGVHATQVTFAVPSTLNAGTFVLKPTFELSGPGLEGTAAFESVSVPVLLDQGS